jgi:uncharacterized protein with von Willebrand factor type A (vWA) domain
MGGFEKLMETLRERLKEQEKRHQGGSKWIGTAGTSPFRRLRLQSGRHPDRPEGKPPPARGEGLGQAGIQGSRRHPASGIPQHPGGPQTAQEFRPHRGGTDELDLDHTIRSTAHKGLLDIKMRPERHNAVKVLAVLRYRRLDGRSHPGLRGALFRRARSEFKVMEHFYFHNCLYEFVWKENRRRHSERCRPWTCFTSTRPTTR